MCAHVYSVEMRCGCIDCGPPSASPRPRLLYHTLRRHVLTGFAPFHPSFYCGRYHLFPKTECPVLWELFYGRYGNMVRLEPKQEFSTEFLETRALCYLYTISIPAALRDSRGLILPVNLAIQSLKLMFEPRGSS